MRHPANYKAKRHDDRSAGQHDPRSQPIKENPDVRRNERPHDRTEHERAGRQSAAPVKLFDDGDQKDSKRIARAKSDADGEKSDNDNDPRVVALQHAAWGDLDLTD